MLKRNFAYPLPRLTCKSSQQFLFQMAIYFYRAISTPMASTQRKRELLDLTYGSRKNTFDPAARIAIGLPQLCRKNRMLFLPKRIRPQHD